MRHRVPAERVGVPLVLLLCSLLAACTDRANTPEAPPAPHPTQDLIIRGGNLYYNEVPLRFGRPPAEWTATIGNVTTAFSTAPGVGSVFVLGVNERGDVSSVELRFLTPPDGRTLLEDLWLYRGLPLRHLESRAARLGCPELSGVRLRSDLADGQVRGFSCELRNAARSYYFDVDTVEKGYFQTELGVTGLRVVCDDCYGPMAPAARE